MSNSHNPDQALRIPRGFYWHVATSFLGAFNDNVFRWLMVGFVLGMLPEGADTSRPITVALMVFVIPFLCFNAAAGVLSDHISKRRIIIWTKLLEVAVMAAGALAFHTYNLTFVYSILFFMALQSTIFGPAKFGILPELMDKSLLSRANGIMEMATWMSIIFGMGLGVMLWPVAKGHYHLYALICVGVAIIGVLTSFGIPKTQPAGGKKSATVFFLRDIFETLRFIRPYKLLLVAVLASGIFMFIAAFVNSTIVEYGKDAFEMKEHQSAMLFFFASFGIGIGSVVAGKISGNHVELGLVPLGSLGIMVALFLLGLVPSSKAAVGVLLFLLGFGGGFFVVPLQAYIQHASPREKLGEILAASSFISWIGVLLGGGCVILLTKLEFTPAQCFFLFGLCALFLTWIALRELPEFWLRLLLVVLTRTIYRIRVYGRENVPEQGAALLVSNHTSWADAPVILAALSRPVRFLMSREIYNWRMFRSIMRIGRIIPITNTDSPKQIVEALRRAREELQNGELVGIFPEGALTRTGIMFDFKAGVEKITKGLDVPIIPVYIGGGWGSILSHAHGKLFAKFPRKLPYPISIHFGRPLPADTSSRQLRQAVSERSCDHYDVMKGRQRNLTNQFFKTARRRFRHKAVADVTGKQLSYNQLMIGTVALGEKLRDRLEHQRTIGVLLPPSVGGVLTNTALTYLGKVTVNLNYSAGPEAFRSAIDQCQLTTVITSRKFRESLDPAYHPGDPLYIEDLLAEITPGDKRRAALVAWLMPRFLMTGCRRQADSAATIIFSSGSTGTPKGVMLSHHNLISNIESARSVLRFQMDDNICGVLPFFHSFGYTVTLWLPLLTGISASYSPTPLDAQMVGRAAGIQQSTFLLTTPTFLLNYIRRVEPEAFAHLRMVVVGAEKLKSRVADMFEKKFHVRPREGYGATELGPIVSFNLPDTTVDDLTQTGTKEGTVGHPIPGIAVKTVDPESLEDLPPGETGMLAVKSPSLMIGYLNNEEKTREVIRDGWYLTGDIACVDDEGFITLTDRLARFSKIGGEMIPHGAIEEVLQQEIEGGELCVAVTSLPDEKKGEQLIVLYTAAAGDADRLQQIIAESNLSNLSRPRRDNYIQVEAIPVLGSGKLDILGLRRLAERAKENASISR